MIGLLSPISYIFTNDSTVSIFQYLNIIINCLYMIQEKEGFVPPIIYIGNIWIWIIYSTAHFDYLLDHYSKQSAYLFTSY